jgi:hypothetical protein
MRTVQILVDRVRAEYLEMPGLRLTVRQVERLCGLEERISQLVLDALVEAKFLCCKRDGRYARLTDGATAAPRPHPAKADIALARRDLKAS